jgi:hypothetical protein
MALSRAERRIVLLSAGIASCRERLREDAGRAIEQVEWLRLAETLRLRRLLPTLGPRIVELAGSRTSEGFVEAVEQALTAGRRRGASLLLVSQRVTDTLAQAGIRSTPLKGPLLSEAIYGDLGRRLSGDLDLLVATEQLNSAVEVVRELGYAAPTDYVERSGLPLLHFVLVHEQHGLPPVELHWRVHCYEGDFARERLLPAPGQSPAGWRPAPADELIALLLFYARDGFVDLRLASDVSAWWDVRGRELQPGAVDQRLRTYPALARVVRAAVKVAERVVGLPAEQVIADVRAPGVRVRIATRLANPNPHSSQSQLYADIGLIDGLLAPPGGFRAFVRRQLLPPREVLAELDRRAPKRRARSSLRRSVGMLGRYGLTMTRLVLRPARALR